MATSKEGKRGGKNRPDLVFDEFVNKLNSQIKFKYVDLYDNTLPVHVGRKEEIAPLYDKALLRLYIEKMQLGGTTYTEILGVIARGPISMGEIYDDQMIMRDYFFWDGKLYEIWLNTETSDFVHITIPQGLKTEQDSIAIAHNKTITVDSSGIKILKPKQPITNIPVQHR